MIHSGFNAIQGVVPGRNQKRWQTNIDFSTGCVMVKPSNTSIVWMVWMLWQWLGKKQEEKEEPSFWAWQKILWFFQKTIYTNVKHDHIFCCPVWAFWILCHDRRRIRERIHPNKIYHISFRFMAIDPFQTKEKPSFLVDFLMKGKGTYCTLSQHVPWQPSCTPRLLACARARSRCCKACGTCKTSSSCTRHNSHRIWRCNFCRWETASIGKKGL